MINNDMARELLTNLPLAYKDLGENKFKYLYEKWGGKERTMRTAKQAMILANVKFTNEEAIKLEQETITLLRDKLRKLFSCIACGKDFRKVGILRHIKGTQTAQVFIDAKGYETRKKEEQFCPEFDGDYMHHFCGACGVDQKDNVAWNKLSCTGITAQGIYDYAVAELGMPKEFVTTRRYGTAWYTSTADERSVLQALSEMVTAENDND